MGWRIVCSEFVKRQTAKSGFSHFNGSWEELEKIAARYINTGLSSQGYKDGVLLIRIPEDECYKFMSSMVTVNDNTKLKVNFGARQVGEDPYIRVAAKSIKHPAKAVELICYRADVLAEDDDRSSTADWEVIAIKARASLEPEPMDPMTMARNYLHLPGGTKGNFSADQFAESIVYWSNHAMCVKQSWWVRLIGNVNRLLDRLVNYINEDQ